MSSYNDPLRNARGQLNELDAWLKRHARTLIIVAVGLVLFIGVFSSYYQVEPDELGVVLRFGKHIGNTDPGPHMKLPFGIDQVVNVPVQRQLKMEFGFRTTNPGVRSEFSRPEEAQAEAVMLTGDLNVGVVEWIVQYKIASPEKFLFNFRDVNETLRLMSEASMRAIVGDHSIDELITGGREAIETEAKAMLVELNRRYDTGIVIQQLKLQDANTPDPVKPALREVEEAKQERERMINEAWADYNKVIPRASGTAQQDVQAAEGYAIERTNHAQGDAARFRDLYEEYRKEPEVTRTRLYLEAMSEVLPHAKKRILVDSHVKSLIPLLNLEDGK